MNNSYVIEYDNHTKQDFIDVWNIESEYLEPSTISSVEKTMEWDNKNSDIHIFIRNVQLNKIVGEITLIPISKRQFRDFMSNKLQDTELNGNNLLNYKKDNSYYLLFSAIAIDKNYRNDRLILGYLLKGLYNKINNLLKKNITFENMCAEGQTTDGQKFIESFLNLKEKNVTNEGYKLYSFDSANEMDEWIRIFPLYIEKYNSTFKLEK